MDLWNIRQNVYLEFGADDLVTKYHHTNLPCLRQSRRRQTSLALKAPRAFNLSKLTLRVAFARYALSASAGRRAQCFQPKRVSALKELEIPIISDSVKARTEALRQVKAKEKPRHPSMAGF
ncbi:hypothetical protein AXE77_06225 [Gardnerella vaginalis]|uniref:Uncharacterized protein n=1 Tax=Gardnerella vaginalis TaxID=2702 RepID=A0A3E1J0P0_GARVA|nr:hypothetical protein AXE77_06225 [Gardnerella vaginalis]